jgi:hypothetical protein
VILTTALRASLWRFESHRRRVSSRTIEIGAGDVGVISAHPIPGNERGVARTITA